IKYVENTLSQFESKQLGDSKLMVTFSLAQMNAGISVIDDVLLFLVLFVSWQAVVDHADVAHHAGPVGGVELALRILAVPLPLASVNASVLDQVSLERESPVTIRTLERLYTG